MENHQQKIFARRMGKEIWAPALAFILVALAAVMLWREERRANEVRVRAASEATAEQVALRLENWIDSRLAVVHHLASEWRPELVRDPKSFQELASQFLRLYPGFQALNWIDSKWVIRIITPEAGNEPALNKDLHHHPDPNVARAIVKAERTGALARTSVVELLQRGKGFATYCPVYDEGHRLVGFINGVFRVDKLISSCLGEPTLRRRFRFRFVDDDGRLVYSSCARPKGDGSWSYQVRASVQVGDRPWTLNLAPSPELLVRSRGRAADLMLVGGLALSAAAAWLLRQLLLRHRELALSEARYRSLTDDVLDTCRVGIAILDRDSRIVWINRAFERYFGVSRRDLVGEDMKEIVQTLLKAAVDEPEDFAQRLIASYEGAADADEFECHVRPEGERKERWLERRSHVITQGPYAGGRIEQYYGITDRKRSEEERERIQAQIQRAQRLESLGVLAGGIAHDFNNMLTVILGHASLAKIMLPGNSRVRSGLAQIEKAAMQAADLCKQMQAYAGGGRLATQSIDLSRLVQDMQPMIESSVSKDARMHYALDESLPLIDGDPTQLQQVVMNLVANASEALEDGPGDITITTDCVDCDASVLRECYSCDDLPAGRYVRLQVADTGCGMDEETRSRIFEPFFTSKFMGRGLGMAAVLGVVRAHHGAIHVQSEPGEGARICILLPPSQRPAAPAGEPPRASSKPAARRAHKSVLLADDEEAVRQIGKRMLETAGFQVQVAGDGQEAVDLFRKQPDGFDLVVLDLTMPRMGGKEAFHEIRRLNPDVRVIVASGYHPDEVCEQFMGEDVSAFVHKPFRMEDLTAAAQSALQGGDAA